MASLVAVNAAVFVAMAGSGLGITSFERGDLLRWGALTYPWADGAGLLRLASYQFVHAGLGHLANNMYGLAFAGLLLEPIVGGWCVIVAYVMAGVLGGVTSLVVHPAGLTVGASGSVFGLFGVLLGLVVLKDPRVSSLRAFILANCAVYVGLNLLLGAVTVGIDNAAHAGGLATGVLLAWLFRRASESAPAETSRS
jgi:rhomboid protease GluP